MNRVIRRSWIMMLFILILVGGTGFFLREYALKANDWAVFPGSPHTYHGMVHTVGIVTDRAGEPLLDTTQERSYASDPVLRQATLHWVGDRNGKIHPAALAHYAEYMVKFDVVDGTNGEGEAYSTTELTLSSRVQKAALEAMAGRKGTVAVYNYRTGQILCAVTTPTFDPDNAPNIEGDATGAYEGIYVNRFTQSAYPPGSIFKIVTTAAALDSVEGILDMTFTCTGRYELGNNRVTCETAHGTRNLKSAMAVSCNCSFAQIAQLIGKEKMTEYVERFRVIESVSFDGITTVRGNYDVAKATPGQLAWSCIGQHTDLINPCSYLRFVGAIAAGGAGVEPYIVERIWLEDEVTYEAKTVYSKRIMSEELAATLREYMRNNVVNIYGAGNFPGLTVCAKSGTSELGGGKEPNAMFSGFVADEQYPLAFIVVVENGGYGSATCVPILSKVLAECKAVMDGQ